MRVFSQQFSLLVAVTGVLYSALASAQTQWVDIWTASPQLSRETLPAAVTNPNGYFKDYTIRMTLHVTLAADQLRIQLSNEFGTNPLEITAASLGLTLADSSGITSGQPNVQKPTLKNLTFGSNSSVTIPAGGNVVSDTVQLSVGVSQDISLSLYLAQGQIGTNTTSHDVAHTTSWLASGDQTMIAELPNSALSVTSWYYATAVEALLSSSIGAMACVGDSITDGTGSTMNGNNRWVNDLFNRTQANAATKNITILNNGIGGNHLAAGTGQGPDAVDRIESILSQPGVKYVTILDGVNDIGHTAATTDAQNQLYTVLVAGLEKIIDQVHAAGLPIFGATLTPFNDPPYSGYTSQYSNPIRENTRNKLNTWILNTADFDYVVDYAAAVANKTDPNQYQNQYAYTNYIHPNVLGHQVMADAWDLSVFEKFANGVPT